MAVQQERKYALTVIGVGAVLIAGMTWVGILSPRFEYGSPLIERPHALLVFILMVCGAAYLLAAWALQRLPSGRHGLVAAILGIGLVLRGVTIFSNPIQEDDYYRYLWDGAVTAHGFNPYPRTPAEILREADSPETLQELARDSGLVFQRVNHPELATVYPPVAQGAFALAHLLKPWSIGAWRAVVFGFDLATLGLLALLLRALGKPLHLLAIYWWNPVLIKEAFNSAHMDLVVLPFALLALLFALRNRPVRSASLLAIAVGAKIWPFLLVPLLCRTITASRTRCTAAAAAFGILLVFLALPLLTSVVLGEKSGLLAYGERWEMNDALFMVFAKGSEIAFNLFGPGEGNADLMARIAVFLALMAWTAVWSMKPRGSQQEVCDRIVLILGAAFMLSPTQFPWYYLWIVPFLALSPRPSMLILTLMLPIYYLKFYFSARDNVLLFHNGIVWLEYAPVFVIALWEWYTHWRPKPPPEAV
ncbi:MAG: DUF2029 domain-containing protein [Candidatus Hydrogenedentes bacterium]|nr:DUF2029 domain-containing protein [Candidatus Hydrogenedentota bacterium]